jgi:hypothetical protein
MQNDMLILGLKCRAKPRKWLSFELNGLIINRIAWSDLISVNRHTMQKMLKRLQHQFGERFAADSGW